MTRDDLVALLSRLHADRRVSVGSKLYVERIQYALGVL
jgi:hypothetical protein